MPPLSRRAHFLVLLLALIPMPSASGEEPQRAGDKAAVRQETPASPAKPGLTGKERLSRKWTDEQRIDNCNVPPDKRGTKPRPDCDARASQ